ncbi:hypothetical protein BH11PSE4_BH11PSE4_01320 [soil metagenome]
MLRFKILASTLPLILAAVFARGEFATATQPCLAIAGTSVQIAQGPWQAQSQVSFTDDSSLANVRVQIVDDAEAADFAVVDDVDNTADDGACGGSTATRFIGISAAVPSTGTVIYLSKDGEADYRVFVKSKTFTARDAAALIVGARGTHARIADAGL